MTPETPSGSGLMPATISAFLMIWPFSSVYSTPSSRYFSQTDLLTMATASMTSGVGRCRRAGAGWAARASARRAGIAPAATKQKPRVRMDRSFGTAVLYEGGGARLSGGGVGRVFFLRPGRARQLDAP